MTFKVFPKAIKKPSTGDGVVEPEVCKQNCFQELCTNVVIKESLNMKMQRTLIQYGRCVD
jgi:hypothetical protein